MKKISQKDIAIISALRNNARESLRVIGEQLSIPPSTIYDKVKTFERDIIKKHVSLIDFTKIGFTCRAIIAIKLSEYKIKELFEYVGSKIEVNNIFEVNNDYDILIECIFRTKADLKQFIYELENTFKIQEKQIFETTNQLKCETFLNNNENTIGE